MEGVRHSRGETESVGRAMLETPGRSVLYIPSHSAAADAAVFRVAAAHRRQAIPCVLTST
jgi:hypothetical protein